MWNRILCSAAHQRAWCSAVLSVGGFSLAGNIMEGSVTALL